MKARNDNKQCLVQAAKEFVRVGSQNETDVPVEKHLLKIN